MTWIIGVNSIFGCSILVSDICVTFTLSNGKKEYIDCLQKIYPLDRGIIGGFSGSVLIGFRLLEYLKRQFSVRPQNSGWNLDVISNTWLPRCLKRIYELSPKEEKRNGCRIILAAAHPTKNRGALDVPWTDVVSFEEPDFIPKKIEQSNVGSIGLGTEVEGYVKRVEEGCSNIDYHKAAMGGNKIQASFVANFLESAVKKNPIQGVSRVFQYAWVSRMEYAIHNYEYDMISPDGEKIEVRFPDIAIGYKHFKQLSQKLRVSAESSCA